MKLIWILTCATFLVVNCVRIEKNGYKEVTISFSTKSQREDFDFAKLKEVLTKASDLLFNATRKRSYFEEFVLVIPSTWSDTDDICDRNVTTVPKKIDIYVTESSDDPTVTTRHSKGCGHKGDIIYIPVNWLKGEAKADDLRLQFVQQWSIFRYGVFPENPESSDSCLATSDSTWSPVGCFNIDVNVDITRVQFDENSGLPLCKFPVNQKETENFRSSIMFSANSSKMLDFCDGSETLPHNPISPTLHNRICEGKAVWSVIKNTDDFIYGRNSARNDVVKPPNIPIFSCFKETKTHITLVMQDSDLEGRNEIRYSLFHFLSLMEPTDFAVELAIFSNDSLTESTSSVEVNLKDTKIIKLLLDSQLNLNEEVLNICLICGLRKAYKVSATSQFSRRIIILFAQESSLENTITSALIEIVQSDANVVLYLVFLEDTTTDIIPLSLEEAVQNTGGKVFRVKNKAVYMLAEINVALLDATGDKLKNEDKILVVHKKVYADVKSDFKDLFLTPRATRGRLYYSLQCEKRGDIRVNNICKDKDDSLQSPVCGNEVDVTADNDSENKWQYEFKFGGNKGTTCLSLALLKLQSSSTASFTVKGWLNNNKITPGQDVLIVYAEIFGNMDQNIEVEARIFGPDGLKEFDLQLRDNGNGDPDVIKGDNIYSRYFTSFTQKGIYTVSIYVKTRVADVNSYCTEKSEAFATIQMKTIGTFTVMQTPPTEDIYPPNRVSDLTVVAINSTNRMVSLQWTAPGDDYDDGTALKYVIKLSEHWSTLMDIAFNLKENGVEIVETDNYTLLSSGSNQIVTVSCALCNNKKTYYIALRAMDDNDNEGPISNIVQVHFKDAYLPPIDGFETSTEKPISTDFPSSFSTEESINFTSSDDNNINTTAVLNPETKDGIFIEKRIIIISASSFIAFIVLLIIFNLIICCCCVRKKQTKEPKKISRNDSLRPPYNINMAYKRGSDTSLEEENPNSNSLNALVHPKRNYLSSDGTSLQGKRYSYHTTNSLRNKMNTQNRKNDLGFKIVEPMPAYATSSLTRFAAKYNEPDTENQTNAVPLQELSNNVGETQIYSLGQV